MLQSGDEREARPLGDRARDLLAVRLPRWLVALVAVAALATGSAGVGVAADASRERAAEAARVVVDVVPIAISSTTVRGVARGELELLLLNRREGRVRLGALRFAVEGLTVQRVQPAFGKPLGPYEERVFTVSFVVPDCRRLVLPGVLTVSLAGDGRPLEQREVAVNDARDPNGAADTVRLGACPPSARGAEPGTPTDVGLRSAGGQSRRTGAGAEGVARLEVRNAGPRVRLFSVDAEVPGVQFVPRLIEGGRSIDTEELVIVRLAFRVPDCARLVESGRVVLRLGRFGSVQEVGLRAVSEPIGGAGPQVDLRVVFNACG